MGAPAAPSAPTPPPPTLAQPEPAGETEPAEQPEPAGESEAAAGSADPRVDDAVARLADVNALPVAEQVEVYADIHRRLAAVLSDPDSQA